MGGPVLGDRKRLLIRFLWLLVYFLSGKLGLYFATVNASTTPFWPPTGIAIALLLIEGYAAWPLILAGAFLVNITTTGGVLSSLGIGFGNTMEAFTAAYLVKRFAGGQRAFNKPLNAFRFTLAATAGSLISSFIGVSILCLSGLAAWANYQSIWTTWWLGNVTGAIIFAPFVLVWFGTRQEKRAARNPIETASFVLVSVAVGEIVFGSYSPLSTSNYPVAFLWIPLVVWAGFRFGLRGTTGMTLLLCPVTIWQTMHGLGPFARGGPNEALLLAQAFTAVLVITSIAIAAVVRERIQMERYLRNAKLSTDRLVEERTADLTASNKALQQTQQDLELLSTRLLEAQDDERRRIARELHDSSGQLISAMAIELGKVSRESEKLTALGAQAVADGRAFLEEISTQVRTLSYLLHPPLLDEFGLIPAVRWYAEGFGKRSGVHVDLDLDESVGRLPIGLETAVFRIVQESLTNIHLHSRSSVAAISVGHKRDGKLHIQVSDQGRGIPDGALDNPGLGISGMRERVKKLGGDLQILSGPTGTTIIAAVPIPVLNEVQP